MVKQNNMNIIFGVLVVVVLLVVVAPQFGVNLGGVQTGLPTSIEIRQEPLEPGDINPVIQGNAVEAPVNVYDSESDTNAELASVPLGVYINGNKIHDVDTFDSDSNITGIQVGDIITIYGRTNGTAPVYVDVLEDFQITGESPTISMTGAQGSGESNLQIVCWDSNGDVMVSGGGLNKTFPDYNVTLGASATEQITCRVKNNVADRAYDLKGVCIGYMNDVDNMVLEGETVTFTDNPVGNNIWTKITKPKHISEATVTDGRLSVEYDVCYERADAIRLSEWEWVKLQFTIEASSTGCAAVAATTLANDTVDLAWILVKDAGWAEGTDGLMYYGIADKGTNERDVGLDETESSPAGLNSGAEFYCK